MPSIRFELENIEGYDSEYHHDAIMIELEMNNPRSFANEILNSVGKLIQLPSTWIDACREVEMRDGFNLVDCGDSECEFDSEVDGLHGDCGCYVSHDLESFYLHTNLTILDGYEVEIEFDSAYTGNKAEIRYSEYDREVVIGDETLTALCEHYTDQFERYN